MEDFKMKKRVRDELDESNSEVDSPEVKRLKENLLDTLDDEEDDAAFCTTSVDLDSFMKSFEEEIAASPAAVPPVDVVDLTSDSGESKPDLGFLLEASDDELGLPPPEASPEEFGSDLTRVGSGSSELSGDMWGFDSAGYDSFDFGIGQTGNFDGGNGEYVALDGLFDHSDLGFGSDDFLWRPETLPAQ